jgi:cytochrome c oxidase subunit II
MREFIASRLNLPVLASEHGRTVDDLIIYVHLLMIVLFAGWLAYFAYALLRFRRSRNPKADYLGVRNHASNYIEVAVAIVEGILLLGVAVPLWGKTVGGPPADQIANATRVQIVAQQFNWNIRYPGKDKEFGKQEMRFVNSTNVFGLDPADPNAKDDFNTVDEMHVVVDKPVLAYISSKDVIHSFKVIAMRVTQDAIPGMRVPIWFVPTKVGHYQINCAQLCGNGHSAMANGMLVVETQADFDKWIEEKSKTAGSSGSLE